MISFDIYNARRIIEHGRHHDFSREVETTLFRAVLETGRSMLAAVDLTYSDNMKDGSFKKEIEIGIIGVRKGLENLIV